MTAGARKTAPRRRIPSYYEIATHTIIPLTGRVQSRMLTAIGAPLYHMYLHVDTLGDAMATKSLRMELMVAKWGNSLAVRLPAESAKQIGVGEGDTLIAEVLPDGRLVLAPEGRVIGKAEVRRLRQFLGRQKETTPVVGEMRRAARY